jgi:putative tricarboxylic transport membrane protein
VLSRGDFTGFVTHPISAGLLISAVTLLTFMVLPALRAKRETVFVED